MEPLLQHAHSLLQQGSPELSLLEAKKALNASRDRRDARPWLAMSKALKAMRQLDLAYTVVAKGCQELSPAHSSALQAEQGLLLEQLASGKYMGAEARMLRSWRLRHEPPPFHQPRVFCLSDLHVDQGRNMQSLNNLSATAFQGDILIVAGDVADSMAGVRLALELLRGRFARVVFCAGNHDLWLRPGDASAYPDSVAKLIALLALCDELDVDTTPVQVQPGTVIVPLNSWYHYTFDQADPRPGRLRFDSFCRWPVDEQEAVWQLMLAFNRPALTHVLSHLQTSPATGQPQTVQPAQSVHGVQHTHAAHAMQHSQSSPTLGQATGSGQKPARGGLPLRDDGKDRGLPVAAHAAPLSSNGAAAASSPATAASGSHATLTVITVSHFLPSPALPFNTFMSMEAAKSVGCLQLSHQLDALGSQVHVHGHTHVPCDMQLSSHASRQAGSMRRHVHNPLDGVRVPRLVCVWDMEAGVKAGYSVDFNGTLRK